MQRGFAVVTLLLAIVAGFATSATAQQINSVNVSGTTSMGILEGCGAEPVTSPGSFTFTRSSTEGALTINYHISGGPTDLNADASAGADHTADFADGAATVTVTVHPAIAGGGATVTVVEGQGYAVGDPASGDVGMSIARASCPAPSTIVNTLPRTGVRSTSGPLALVGITSIALGCLLLIATSRRKAAS